MPQIMLGFGVDAAGNVTNLYTGPDYSGAKAAVDAAGMAGTVIEGYIYRYPVEELQGRFDL
jgi:hypothetical protein